MRIVRHFALLTFGAAAMSSCTRAEEPLSIAVLLDGGGRGDNGFNDAAVRGANRAAAELGVRVRFVDPSTDGDELALLRRVTRDSVDVVVGVGFQFSRPFDQIAPELPRVRFAAVDYQSAADARGAQLPPPANVTGLVFREDQGAFLVGAIAGLTSRTHTVGFVGGMDSDVIHRFESGFRAGAHHVCPTCRVVADYAGDTPAAFADPKRGKALALAQYAGGADVVFHASGKTGDGVLEAAREVKKFAIGVDVDQSWLAPGYVLTSMTKRVDVAVYEAIKRAHGGTLPGGTLSTLGLAERGVDYVYNDNNRWLIDPVRQQVEQLRARIVSGAIPTTAVTEHAAAAPAGR